MALSTEERATLTERLTQAESAYHDLQIGHSARVVVDGLSAERVEFTSANSSKLYSYILDLKSKLGLLDPVQTVDAPSFRPIQFFF